MYRYQDRLIHSLEHALGSHDDALEIAQQAFVLAWQKLAAFRGDSAFYSWLYRIARNAAISRKRRNRLVTGSLDALSAASHFEPADPAADNAPDYPLDHAERLQAVRDALQQIPEDFRQPLVMKEIDGFSYEEIASILEIPMGTVRSRIFRARQELTDRLRRLMRE